MAFDANKTDNEIREQIKRMRSEKIEPKYLVYNPETHPIIPDYIGPKERVYGDLEQIRTRKVNDVWVTPDVPDPVDWVNR